MNWIGHESELVRIRFIIRNSEAARDLSAGVRSIGRQDLLFL